MPYWSVIGSFSGVMLHTAVSPVLYELGLLPRWVLGMDTIRTSISTGIDFWRAFSIGITLAVTFVSFYQLFTIAKDKRAEAAEKLRSSGGVDLSSMCKHHDCNQHAEVRGVLASNTWAVVISTCGYVLHYSALLPFIPSYWQKCFFQLWSAFGFS